MGSERPSMIIALPGLQKCRSGHGSVGITVNIRSHEGWQKKLAREGDNYRIMHLTPASLPLWRRKGK
ncbi:uncharacterized protein EpC_04090 [Erwinia pyrifoliae Ep1/96]|nr:hypothetical protein CPI84_16880 [Erwinia pyrifoliae]CAX54167.1 uncharacterized protein EpC_04090 [Erwinia pyrifoliae Ep1/96]